MIIDQSPGVQSLCTHLSSIEVGEARGLGCWNGEDSPTAARTSTEESRSIGRRTLASISPSPPTFPVLAANRGKVLSAGYLGIYGNCVIVDHGLGVQSLHAHLSTIEVREGDQVEQGQMLGRSGQTGLAGDHRHFTMLVDGPAENPAEWRDPHWIEDRVFRNFARSQRP